MEISIAGQGSKALDALRKSLPFLQLSEVLILPRAPKNPKKLKQQSVDVNVFKQDTLKLEIMWCTEVVMCNYSYRSCEKKNDLFASMFPNSKIASQFCPGKTKCAYTILYGIALYVID